MEKNISILIIDDDPDDVELFREALAEVDSTVECVSKKDGVDALSFLSEDGNSLPDLIFLDLNMPRLNGLQCLAEIKKIKKTSEVPVIIYSTTLQKHVEEVIKKMNRVYFVRKPAHFPEICNVIRSSLQKI